MEQLAENIKKYRLLAKLTQEELGQKIGVSGQAVSKWEKGSMPDASILPSLADALDVSIDLLYGRKRKEKQNIYEEIVAEISENDPNRFDKAYQIALLSSFLAISPKSLIDLFGTQNFVFPKTYGFDNLAKLASEKGYVISNLTKDSEFMMLVKRKKDFEDMLMPVKDYTKLFSVLANEKVLEILFFFSGIDNETFVLKEVIAEKIHLSVKDTEKYIDKMCECNLLVKYKLLKGDETCESYTIGKDAFILSLLVLAKTVYSSNLMMVNIDESLF